MANSIERRASDVRVQEVDLSTTLFQNSNITAAAVGVTSQGPAEETFSTSYEQWAAIYGPENVLVSYDHACIRAFFLEGNSLWFKRALTSSTAAADVPRYGAVSMGIAETAVKAYSLAYLTIYANAPRQDTMTIGNSSFPTATYGATGKPLYMFYHRRGPASNSENISIRIESQNLEPVSNLILSSINEPTGTLVTGTQYKYRVAAFNAEKQTFVSIARSTAALATGRNAVRLTWTSVPGASGYVVFGRNYTGALYIMGVLGASTLTFVDDGTVTPDTTGTVWPGFAIQPVLESDPDSEIPVSPFFKLKVYDSAISSIDPVETYDCSVTDYTDVQGMQMECAQRINQYSTYLRCVSAVPLALNPSALRIWSTTTYNPEVLTQSTYVNVPLGKGRSGAAPTAADINRAWETFLNKTKYNVDVLLNNGRATPAIQRHMEYIARRRDDAVAFLDMPTLSQTVDQAIDYRNIELNLNSSFAAVFTSDLLVQNPITGSTYYIPPSGSMAALLARTARVGPAYRSIAGLNRGIVNALDVRYVYEDTDAGRLTRAQVNYVRKFLGAGDALWEEWTLYNKPSAFQFISVRVLCNIIKRSTYQFLLYSLREPNDEQTAQQIVRGLSSYMEIIQGTRGVERFAVVSNKANNPAAVVNNATRNVTLYIVPILGLREIGLTLAVGKAGLEISEDEIANLSL